MSNTKKPSDTDATRLINPATDTLKLDIELAKATDPLLIIIRGTPQGKKYVLKGDAFILGRDKTADLQLNDQNVSRQHVRITKQGNQVFIEDCGSRNGTYLNDEKIGSEKKELSKEDMIKVGSTVLKFLPAGELETLYQANLTDKASLDELTGLYNRNYISQVLDAEFKRAKALHSDFSIVLFDIDNFKKINDTYGHDGGDYVLKNIGKELKGAGLRERDMAGRYGGEEFLVILSNSDSKQGMDVAERIRKRIESFDFTYDGKKIPVTVSLGVAQMKKEHAVATDIYKAADKALYESKHTGKNKATLAG